MLASSARRSRTLRSTTTEPVVTYALIAINVLVFLAEGAVRRRVDDGRRHADLQQVRAERPVDVANGDYWRIVTSGFLHAGLLHIGFNMYLLYLLGTHARAGDRLGCASALVYFVVAARAARSAR